MAYFLFGLYAISLIYISIYCLMQVHLLYFYRKNRRPIPTAKTARITDETLPFVTVQLPIYNELYVVERLIDNIVRLEYPKNKVQFHILDDSTDETVALVRAKVEHYQRQGFDIQQIQRTDRKGYKAGALKDAMTFAKGSLIAIFDADFLPNSDFLLKTVPFFEIEKVGVVQTRWEHLNANYSLLTRLQAMQLDVHFTVEQKGRYSGDCLLQFNGTAGIWRRETIDSAGGWEADTLTEDLDLSYRAQLKGWQILYLEDVGSPAELPAEMNGLKSQQFRWTKGGAETARKMVRRIWYAPDLTWRQKTHATTHLFASAVFIFVFLAGVTSVPLVFWLDALQVPFASFFLVLFLLALIGVISVYYEANVRQKTTPSGYLQRLLNFISDFPLFLALSMGLSLHNSIAVLQGYWGKKTAFVRTPKFNLQSSKDTFSRRRYLARRISTVTMVEGLLALYFWGGFWGGIFIGDRSFLVFHALLAVGFSTITYYTVQHLSKS